MSASLFYGPRSEGSPLGRRGSPLGKSAPPWERGHPVLAGALEALPPSGSPPTRPNKGLRYPGAGLDQSVSACVAASVVSKDGK